MVIWIGTYMSEGIQIQHTELNKSTHKQEAMTTAVCVSDRNTHKRLFKYLNGSLVEDKVTCIIVLFNNM